MCIDWPFLRLSAESDPARSPDWPELVPENFVAELPVRS